MTAATLPRVFIVEDHDIVRLGIEKLLEGRFAVVGSADDVGSAVELIRERNPDVVLLDVSLPGGGGVVVIEALRRTHQRVKFLAFTVSTSRHDVLRLMRAGASGYVVKTTDRYELIDLIDQVLAGGIPISPEVAGYLLDIDDDAHTNQSFGLLTHREREVATYIARGWTYREIAEALGISVKTLETHVRHIFEKLGVSSRHELAEAAFGTGFVQPGREAANLPTGTVTFLLTDIVGSTALWERYPVEMARALARHDGFLAEAITSCQGSVVKSTGDGILAVFHRAGSAVVAALAAREALLRDGFSDVGRLGVRMVLVTGEADERAGDYFGPVLNEAATLLNSCGPGQILGSPITKAVTGNTLPTGFEWEALPAASCFELAEEGTGPGSRT
ncbi:MAG: response regulator [Acidimicrobiia bacterium]